VSVIGMIVKLYSYGFHLVLAMFMTGLAVLAFSTGMHNLRLDMLPWSGTALSWWLLGLGLAGLAAVALAVVGMLRVLFLVWTVVVLALMIRGFFLSSYTFGGWEGLRMVLLLLAGAGLAAVGGWLQFRYAPAKR
jgi:hypothetical protein